MNKAKKHNHLPANEAAADKEGPKKKKFRLSRRLIWSLVLAAVVLAVGGLIWAANRPVPPELIIEFVEKGRLTQTVEASGELESADEVKLSFDISGAINQVLVAVGDQVEIGQELVKLDTAELQANVNRALQAVETAQAQVNERLAGSTNEAVQVAQAGVATAQARLASAKVDLQNRENSLANTRLSMASAVNEAEVAVRTAKDSLDGTRTQNAQTLNELEEDLISVLKNGMISVRSALSSADEILGLDNSTANNDFENVLGALDSTALMNAENAYLRAKDSRDRAEAKVFGLNADSVAADINEAVYFTQVALTNTETALWYTRQTLDGTTAGTSTFTEADLSALKSSIDLARDDIHGAQNSLQSQLQLIDSTEISSNTAETGAINALASAEQALNSARASQMSQIAAAESAVRAAQAQIQVAETDLQQAEANLAQVLAGPRAVDLAALQAQVRQARADLEAAQARLKKATLFSPISGRVTSLAYKAGEQVTAGQTMAVVQSLEDSFQIVANIAESDIAKVELGDSVDVTFDAFGDDVHLSAAVAAIDPAEKLIEGVVYYEVTIRFLPESNIAALKPGMSADLEILTADLKDVLIVPQRAVLERPDNTKYVRVPGGELFEEREVETGLRGDGGKVEIKAGVGEGEEIILTIREN